jgi:hypothetical protein
MKSEATIRHRSPYRIITCRVEALRPTTTLSPMRTWSFARLQKSTTSLLLPQLLAQLTVYASGSDFLPTTSRSFAFRLTPHIVLQGLRSSSHRSLFPRAQFPLSSSPYVNPLETSCHFTQRSVKAIAEGRCAQHTDSFQPSHRFSRCLVSHHSSFCITNHLCSLRNGRTTLQRYAVLEPPGIHRPATIQSASA